MDQFYAVAELFHFFNNRTLSTIVPIQGQSKKEHLNVPLYQTTQKPQKNQRKTQKLTNPYAQLFRFLWQSVTKYIQTYSKPVNIFKTFEKHNIYLIKYPLLPTECCVWGTSYLNDKSCPPKCSHISTQHWNFGGIGPRFFVTDCRLVSSGNEDNIWQRG